MAIIKLVDLSDFTTDILKYVQESGDHKRGIQLIEWYKEILLLQLSEDMFTGDQPFIPNMFGYNIRKPQNIRSLSGSNTWINLDSSYADGYPS